MVVAALVSPSAIDRPGSSEVSDLFVGAEATLCLADPPRETTLAFWLPAGRLASADDEMQLVLPTAKAIRRRMVPVRIVPVAAVLEELLALPAWAPVGPSIRAWAVASRLAVDLVARGRLLPSVTEGGFDTWRLGPLDPDDLRRQGELAAALPGEAYCRQLGTGSPLRLPSPHAMVRAFGDAVADLLPRTSAAALSADHQAFATIAPQSVGDHRAWFAESTPTPGAVGVSLRLHPPEPAEGRFSAELVLQSSTDPSLIVAANELWDAPSVVLTRFADADNTLLLTLRRAAQVWSPLHRLLQESRPTTLTLDDDECDQLLGPVAGDLAATGLSVQWPAELLQPLTVRAVVSTQQPTRVVGAGLTLDAILGWEASLDGLGLTSEELEQLASAKRGIVRLRGRWIRVDPTVLQRLTERRSLSAGAALSVALGGKLVIDGEPLDAHVLGPLANIGERLANFDFDRDQVEPAGLKADLRPYQRRGLAWLDEMASLGLGGVLADDMGLGKTVQLLALHLHRHRPGLDTRQSKPTLVVCPATLVANWEREANRFAPDIPVRRYHGRDRTLDHVAPAEIVVTTYGVARRNPAALAAIDWGLVVADEAQAIKNPLSRSARSMRQIGADARFALTGTPVENQLSELWAICDWTTPGLLGPLEAFRREVATPIERDGDRETAAWLSTLVRPFVLRRRKTDPGIAPDLPPKTETDRVVPLSTEQTTLYKSVVEESLDRIKDSEGISRRGLVLKLLTELKQICNHPAHFLKQPGPLHGRSTKLDALTELLEIVANEGAAALVFTQYVQMGTLIKGHLESLGLRVSFLHGALGLKQRQKLVDDFQAGNVDVFILSLKAGGTGLNLTQATHVVHFDRWWNPAVEDQASDRAWRIGQDKPVQVHRLICEGTIEDRIAELLRSKRELADQVVGGGEAWVSELDDADLAALVNLSASSAGER